ncbi:MAG: hypothetical protein NC920_06280 [Candidatus Omnitrophica bacterium]|nr:hypothetical protein [Candidatus Omnitrophota bacterium]
MKNKIFLIFAFNLFFNFGICEEKIPLDNLNMRRIRGSLSAQAKELQRILDDPQINKIDDEKLLLGGILDELLRIDRKYEDLYRDKATPKVLEIYQRVREGKEDFRQHRGIFEGRQGLINAAIMARDAIKRLLGLYTVEGKYDPEFLKRIPKSWERWLQGEDVKLKTAYILLGVNNIIREALSPELYVASQPDKPHYFHEVDIFNQIMWNTPEGERIAYEMIEHFLEDHSEFPLDTAPFSVIDWTEWCRRFNLYNMLINKFQGSAIKMLKYRYPEKFYPNEGHIWHDWDFRVGRWTPELIIQAIKHNIEDPIHGEGWDVNVKSKEFVNNVNSWKEWFTSRGLRGLLQSQFGDSPVEAFKFVYPDKFDTGLWKESDFETKAGKGPAKLFHTPVKLEKPCRKGFGYVRYNFGVDYEGFWVNKLNDYYGGLWKEEDGKLVLLYVFSLIKHPGPEILILTKGETLSLFQPVPNKLKNIFDRLARKVDSAYELFPEDEIKEKMRVLADLGITEPMRQLSLSEQTALLDFLIQTDGLEILQRYLNYFSPQNKLSALKVGHFLVGKRCF